MTQPAGNGFDRGKWFYNHPKVAELRQSGITDSDLIFLTITVYIHLIEGCNWFDVKLHPFPHLQKVLISGYKRRECPVKELVLPIRSGYQFQPESLSILMNTREFHSLTDQKNLNVAIVSGSSKVVFYKVSDDLVPPVTPN